MPNIICIVRIQKNKKNLVQSFKLLSGRDGWDRAHPGVGPYPSSADPGLIKVTRDKNDHRSLKWKAYLTV